MPQRALCWAHKVGGEVVVPVTLDQGRVSCQRYICVFLFFFLPLFSPGFFLTQKNTKTDRKTQNVLSRFERFSGHDTHADSVCSYRRKLQKRSKLKTNVYKYTSYHTSMYVVFLQTHHQCFLPLSPDEDWMRWATDAHHALMHIVLHNTFEEVGNCFGKHAASQ